jgi:dolichol-phosphate mannosyltransferase
MQLGTCPWISVATYNERENIAALLQGIHSQAPQCHVVVTDDNSPDGTGDLLDELAAGDPRVRVIHRPGKLGFASAHRGGMAYALEQGADVVLTMDADFSHDPAAIPALLACIERGADVAIGSRYVRGGGTRNWPWHRRVLSRGSSLLTQLGLGVPVHDCTGGFRAYRASLLKRLRLDKCQSAGYSFQEESLLLCRLAGASFAETPIIFADRRAGLSKISRQVITEAMTLLFRLSWRRVLDRRRLAEEFLMEGKTPTKSERSAG